MNEQEFIEHLTATPVSFVDLMRGTYGIMQTYSRERSKLHEVYTYIFYNEHKKPLVVNGVVMKYLHKYKCVVEYDAQNRYHFIAQSVKITPWSESSPL